MDVEDQEEVLDSIKLRAGVITEKPEGGYRSNVESISLDDFRAEIRRGLYGGR